MYCIATLNQHNLEVTHIWGSLLFWSIKKNGLEQWFSNFFSTGRTMVQVQVSWAARMSFTYYQYKPKLRL